MIAELIDKIESKLIQSGLQVKEINFKDLVTEKTQTIGKPSVSIVCDQSTARKLAMNTYNYRIIVSLILTTHKLPTMVPRAEKTKKQQVYELIEAIIDTIQLQKFGLDLENGLIPMGFRYITPYPLYEKGYQVYQIQFWSSFNVKHVPAADEDKGTLLSILAQYEFPPDSTTVWGSDLINF